MEPDENQDGRPLIADDFSSIGHRLWLIQRERRDAEHYAFMGGAVREGIFKPGMFAPDGPTLNDRIVEEWMAAPPVRL